MSIYISIPLVYFTEYGFSIQDKIEVLSSIKKN